MKLYVNEPHWLEPIVMEAQKVEVIDDQLFPGNFQVRLNDETGRFNVATFSPQADIRIIR